MVEKTRQLITQKEAAAILGKTLQSIQKLVKKGRLRSRYKYGRRVIYAIDVFSYVPGKPGRPRKLKSSTFDAHHSKADAHVT